MTTTIQNFTGTTRRVLCAAMAVLIVSAGLTIGAVGANSAYHSAVVKSTAPFA